LRYSVDKSLFLICYGKLRGHCEECSDEAISLLGRGTNKDCFAAFAMTSFHL
jgi:hypothetical protein